MGGGICEQRYDVATMTTPTIRGAARSGTGPLIRFGRKQLGVACGKLGEDAHHGRGVNAHQEAGDIARCRGEAGATGRDRAAVNA